MKHDGKGLLTLGKAVGNMTDRKSKYMFSSNFTNNMKQARLRSGLTQAKAAEICGLTRIRWTHLEKGYRSPNRKEVAAMQRFMQISRGRLKPPNASRNLFKAGRISMPTIRPYIAQADRPTFTRYLAAKRRHPELVSSLTCLAQAREDFELCAYLCSLIAADSYLEAVYLLYLLALGARPCFKSPAELGYLTHPIVDPATKEYVGNRPFPCFHIGAKHYFFQTAFVTPRLWVADVLVWDGGWRIVELDGEGHDAFEDRIRDELLQIPVRRISSSALIEEIKMNTPIAGDAN